MLKPIITMLAVILALSGCASSYKPSVYQGGQAQQAMRVKLATVVEVREVEIAARNTGTGATTGAAIGGVAGAYSGGRGGIVSSIAGALVGGVIGNAVEKGVNAAKGVEITYRLDGSNELMALVQEQDETNLITAGDRVKIVEGATTRATRLAASAGL
jgi:outer membrane lipoprotein SlyB